MSNTVKMTSFTMPSSGYEVKMVADQDSRSGHYLPSLPLRRAAERFGNGQWSVWRGPIPRDMTQAQDVIALGAFCEMAFVHDTKVVFMRIGDIGSGWMSAFNQLGFEIFENSKLTKRTKFHRATPLHLELDDINVLELPGDSFLRDRTDELVVEFGINVVERVLDGMIVMPERMRTKMVDQITIDSSLPDDDPIRAQAIDRLLETSRLFNIRIWDEPGQWKGQCYFVPDKKWDKKYGEEVDMVVVEDSVKSEVRSHGKVYIQAEPQNPKWNVQLDDQTYINHWKLFRISDIKTWLNDELTQVWKRMERGELLEGAMDVLASEAALVADGYYDDLLKVGERWNAIEAKASGLDLRTMPDLLNTVMSTVTRKMWNAETGRARPTVPCAWHMQVMSNSVARMCGWEGVVDDGTIRILRHMSMAVVSDRDYILNYANWGGCDHDDFFNLYFRTINGERVVVVVRSPNSIGEYATFNFVEDDPYPEWTRADDSVISFPEVNGRGWPKQITNAVADGTVTYTGLPSTLSEEEEDEEGEEQEVQPYSWASFATMVFERQGNQDNVGGVINAEMLDTMINHRHRGVQLCPHEDKVDTFVQGGEAGDRNALMAEARQIVMDIVNSGKPVDGHFWTTRNMGRMLPRDHQPPKLYDGPVTRLVREVRNAVHEFIGDPHKVKGCESCVSLGRKPGQVFQGGKVYRFGQEHAVPDPMLKALGQRMLGDWGGSGRPYRPATGAYKVLRWYRNQIREINQANAEMAQMIITQLASAGMPYGHVSTSPDMTATQWRGLYRRTEAMMWDQTKNDPALMRDLTIALALSAYERPTQAGRIRENVVTNRMIWKHYLGALRFYGMATDMFGHGVTEWEVECVNCHRTAVLHDARNLQVHEQNHHICSRCQTLGEWTLTCRVTGQSHTTRDLKTIAAFVARGEVSLAGYGLKFGELVLSILNNNR